MGVPTFFRACCIEASRGGSCNYSDPGYHLASALYSQIPDDMDDDEWQTTVEGLLEGIDDDDRIWSWFVEHYPKCMKLVPMRRKERFAAGVKLAFEQGRIEN